jgi:hypothetical protein
MPKHEVGLHLPGTSILQRDAVFVVYSDDALLGRLLVSKGGVDWWPANNKKFHWTMGWEKFADVMTSNGRQKPSRA